MNAKFAFAVAAVTLAASPMALAQTGQPYNNDASRSGYERSSPSGLPTTSPQVRSLPDEQPDPWSDRPVDNRSWNDRATSGSSSAYPSGSYPSGSYPTGRAAVPSGTAGSTMGTTMDRSGTMGTTDTMQGNRQVLMNVDPNVNQRADRGQNRKELMQTSLLNYFSAAGFVSVRDFRKQGDNYVAEAQDQNGRWSTVELDSRTGTISAVR